ncbi:class II aldolase/adducin family protein [Bradyrhizobium diazoefficiens]
MTTRPTTAPRVPEAATELVDANRILFNQGVLDGFGHVSMRDPDQPDKFWLSRNRAPALVEVDDLMLFDFNGHAEGDDRKPYLERFIHGEIYRSRSDVMAVVHSHSPTVVPFTVVDVPFRPVCHMCGFIGGHTPVFDIRDVAGVGTDLLIRDSKLGAELAACIGEANLALMRGHGITVVGKTLHQAVFRAVYAEQNARFQSEALRLSPNVTYLSDGEIVATSVTMDGQIDRAWDLWKRAIGA